MRTDRLNRFQLETKNASPLLRRLLFIRKFIHVKTFRKGFSMPNIAEYTDHRKFLNDYYEEAKSRNAGFSYQTFSQKAGIKSKGFLYNVIRGARDLSKANIFGLAQAMKLTCKEAEYFENLVAFNLSKSLNERNHYYERLSSIKIDGKTQLQTQIVRSDQYEFYSKWYHSVIRSLIDLQGFDGNYEKLAKSVFPKIKPLQAKKSVELLVKLGLVKKEENGTYKVTDKSISTPKEVLNLAITNYHMEIGTLAVDSINTIPVDKRNFSAMTLGISRDTYNEICEDIYNLRKKILQKVENDKSADNVYQLNFQFFPVSRTYTERKSI
jgi:uncharacterized protein (TIGR02147 family)